MDARAKIDAHRQIEIQPLPERGTRIGTVEDIVKDRNSEQR